MTALIPQAGASSSPCVNAVEASPRIPIIIMIIQSYPACIKYRQKHNMI
jgi:hypothetical protein